MVFHWFSDYCYLVSGFKHFSIIIIWDNPSHWLFFFKMVKTTNQFLLWFQVYESLMISDGISIQWSLTSVCWWTNSEDQSSWVPTQNWWCVFTIIIIYHYHRHNHYYIYIYNRRKFRSQTSDNMERWKAEQGRGREKRQIRREKIRRERVRRQKMQMREKVGKSRNTVFSNDLWLRRVEK